MAKIAIVLGEDFEDSEFKTPYDALRAAGHQIDVLGAKRGETMKGKKGEQSFTTDAAASEKNPKDYDALVIPGGYSPDHLRVDKGVVDFVKRMVGSGKIIAAICHGPQLLIEADAVKGKQMTSWPSVRKDLENAGATWVDQEVVTDGTLITSRKPADLAAFSTAIDRALGAPAARA